MSRHNCELLKNAVYGKRSEKAKNTYADQISFLFNEAEVYAEIEVNPIDTDLESEPSDVPLKKKAGRKVLPANLPREEIIHELKGDELKCNCGEELIHIGSDESEQLDAIPAKVIIKSIFAINMLVEVARKLLKEQLHLLA